MSVSVTYQCGGCDAQEVVTGIMRRQTTLVASAFVVNGVAYDKVRSEIPTIESSAPEGWMPFDPYTGTCYCPTCWHSIENDVVSA